MEEKSNPIKELEDRLEALRIRQGLLADEIMNLSRSLRQLKAQAGQVSEPEISDRAESMPEDKNAFTDAGSAEIHSKPHRRSSRVSSLLSNLNDNLEDFIGASLISKIGIVAIVIGVGIGIKYAFDHDLISPPVRIAMGYAAGAVLLFFNYRLRSRYPAFSAVLLSGALAIMYYTSFAAHVYYELLSQGTAFTIMVLLTIYAVGEALRTDQPVIAHFGLVGAYAVPYLLGDDPDQINFLFTYVAIVNIGILAIALWRYWKNLYYAAFGITWLIYATWLVFDYRQSAHYTEALIFASVFFTVFYLTFLAYKLIKEEQYHASDVAMLLLNSFIFYGFGYAILQGRPTGEDQLGFFTLINALVHLGVSAVVYQFKLADRNLFYLVAGVGLIFATIAVPVQLDGSWVTFLWAGEAALLFWIGRSRGAPAFEKLSYALFPLAFLSLLQDMSEYNPYRTTEIVPLFNIHLLTSLWSAACFGAALFINKKAIHLHPLREGHPLRNILDYGLAVLFILTLYLAFLVEINYYFEVLAKQAEGSHVWMRYQMIWGINYSLFFVTILSLINIFRLRSRDLGLVTLTLSTSGLTFFLLGSLLQFADLQEIYSDPEARLSGNAWLILSRYLSYPFAGGLLWAMWRQLKDPTITSRWRIAFDVFLHIALLSVLSLELYCWMTFLNAGNSFQAGLSILWGLYALLLIGLGIRWARKHLRIAAIVLVAITLLKVALIDLADLDTPTKTVVLVILGGLLLGISFLYNKFREVLFGSGGEN